MEISLSSGNFPYLEFGWVTAPNAAGQSIPANTVTTLTIDTEIVDLGGFGSIAANQVNLAAGTYFFKGSAPFVDVPSGSIVSAILGLYNVTDSFYITRLNYSFLSGGGAVPSNIEGQFTIAGSKAFDLRVITNVACKHVSGAYNTLFSLATAGTDQRATLKLWKVG